jgi:twitching motility protein PilT
MEIHELLAEGVEKSASDVHLIVGKPPIFRIYGELVASRHQALTADACRQMIYEIMREDQVSRFEQDLEMDLSLFVSGVGRFRVNVHQQKGVVEAAFRTIPLEMPAIQDLGLPDVVNKFTELQTGLVLVTGPTGMGKSTTLAALVDRINETHSGMIVTIEDPIEFVHEHKSCVVKQREVGTDTHSFSEALRHALRQDPDIILVGEMRDRETIATAITAAETGHLVLSTLHTPDAAHSIDRLIDVFPPHQQQQIKVQLSGVLRGIVSQRLIPRADGSGMALAAEVLIATPAVRHLIREHKTDQIETVIQTNDKLGMKTMDNAITELYEAGLITRGQARAHAIHPEQLKLPTMVKR